MNRDQLYKQKAPELLLHVSSQKIMIFIQNEMQFKFMIAFCKISLFHFDFTINPDPLTAKAAKKIRKERKMDSETHP